MAEVKLKYATSSNLTLTLASLADNASRESTVVDNSTNLYLDAMLYLKIKVGTVANEKAVYCWFYGSEDGTNYTDAITGTDAAFTMTTPTNLRGPFIVSTPSNSTTYKSVVGSVAAFFGGVLPRKWGIVIENQSGAALDSTEGNHGYSYSGITETVA